MHVVVQELGLYKAQTKLPFNAFGTMAMAREVKILSFPRLYNLFDISAFEEQNS